LAGPRGAFAVTAQSPAPDAEQLPKAPEPEEVERSMQPQQSPLPPPRPGDAGHPPPSGGRTGLRKAGIIGLIAVTTLTGAGAFGVNSYAKHTVCSSLEGDLAFGTESFDASSDWTSADGLTKMRDTSDELRGQARMLIFDTDLRSAMNGFADDVDRLADLVGSEEGDFGTGFVQLISLAGSVNSHAMQAQRACGLPAEGVLDL
jgi:hypothetical protein